MSDNLTLSIIIRFNDPGRLPLLDEALFSIALQMWPQTEVVVVIQNGDQALETKVGELIEIQPWRDAPRYQVFSVPIPPGVDGRSNLLNQGMARAAGRYLAFLDDDDYVYQHGYRLLIESLQKSGAGLAAGACRVAHTRRGKNHWYTTKKLSPYKWGRTREDLFIDNFLPIHSFVIDRARVAADDLWFDPEMPPLEDYDFLLRLAVKYKFDLSQIETPVCEYRYHGENSIQLDQYGEPVPSPRILQARATVYARKERMTITMPITELLEIRQQGLPPPRVNEELLLELLTKDQRSLNKLADKIYGFARQRPQLLSWLVKSTRGTRKVWGALLQALRQREKRPEGLSEGKQQID